MKIRLIACTVVVTVILGWADSTWAHNPFHCLATFCHNVHRDWKRNNCWPEPFVCPDRQLVREPFITMVANGWQRQNTLSDDYFQPGTHVLTPAGKNKVRWILTEAPENHRILYVYRAIRPEDTAKRISEVQKLAQQFMPEGEPPTVLQTNIRAKGWPAQQVDHVNRKFIETMPPPRLPAASTEPGAAIN